MLTVRAEEPPHALAPAHRQRDARDAGRRADVHDGQGSVRPHAAGERSHREDESGGAEAVQKKQDVPCNFRVPSAAAAVLCAAEGHEQTAPERAQHAAQLAPREDLPPQQNGDEQHEDRLRRLPGGAHNGVRQLQPGGVEDLVYEEAHHRERQQGHVPQRQRRPPVDREGHRQQQRRRTRLAEKGEEDGVHLREADLGHHRRHAVDGLAAHQR
mmetsp:Transcript_5413/g.14650  ORF Transcript_5413/g.14650 Transcript_5413/m.14650 type:complete len:213 (-) Transcript_5413:250-888(-)